MSRIGKQPVKVPSAVKANIAGQLLKIEGPKGKLERELHPEVGLELKDGQLLISPKGESKLARAMYGTERALIANMVEGVSQGFVKELELIGVGFRADLKGSTLNLALGYSHPIDYNLPKGVSGSVLKEGRQIFVRLESSDKQQLGQVAAEIRSLRPPEPYKGKGVRYRNEVVKIKAGKAGKK